jgi:hypothetical protein
MQPSVYDLPKLPANASAYQAEAWLAAYRKARRPTPKEEAAFQHKEAALFRVERDRALRFAEGLEPGDPKHTCLHALADIAELYAQRCDREADRLDPLPF